MIPSLDISTPSRWITSDQNFELHFEEYEKKNKPAGKQSEDER
jgi:hypothetical protein